MNKLVLFRWTIIIIGIALIIVGTIIGGRGLVFTGAAMIVGILLAIRSHWRDAKRASRRASH